MWLAGCPVLACAGLVCLERSPQSVFAGEARRIQVIFRNPTDRMIEIDVRLRLLQCSSATAVPLGSARSWEKLHVLAEQTIIESVSLTFPLVKTATRFLVEWLDDHGQALGQTEVIAYPPDLLRELKPLAGGEPLGLFDPQNQIKPLLARLGVDYTDLETVGLEQFSGRLAIIGPFAGPQQRRADLVERTKTAARAGLAVVWIEPATTAWSNGPMPVELARLGRGAIAVANAEQISDAAGNPLAQLNLIRLAHLALKPEQTEPLRLTP